MSDKSPGRPAYTDEQYSEWLLDMKPFYKRGCSIHYAVSKAGLEKHYDSILEKYKAGDWFSRKIDAYRAYPGELVNDTFISLLFQISDRVKNGEKPSRDDIDVIKFMGEKHRSAQPFFVSRTETAVAKEDQIGKILDTLETDYDDVARKAEGQVLEADPSLQDKRQTGSDSDLPSE